MSKWITDRLPTREDCASVEKTLYKDLVWTMVLDCVVTSEWRYVNPGIAWQPIVIERPEPYVAPKSNYYVQFRLVNELGKKNRWVVCCRENTSPINDKTICDIDGIQADNLPTYEAAERVAAIYNEVMP